MEDMIAGTPAPAVGDKVEVVQRAVGRFKGPVLAIDSEFLTIGVVYPTGRVRESRISRKSIQELKLL